MFIYHNQIKKKLHFKEKIKTYLMLYHQCKVGDKRWKIAIFVKQNYLKMFKFLEFLMDMEVISIVFILVIKL